VKEGMREGLGSAVVKVAFLVTLGLVFVVYFFDIRLLDATSEHRRAIESIEAEFATREKKLQLLREEIRRKSQELENEEKVQLEDGVLSDESGSIRIPQTFEVSFISSFFFRNRRCLLMCGCNVTCVKWESKCMNGDDEEVRSKREAIRSMMRFAWQGYMSKVKGKTRILQRDT